MANIIRPLVLIVLIGSVSLKGVTLELTRGPRVTTSDNFLAETNGTLKEKIGDFRNISYYAKLGFGRNDETGEINWAPIAIDTGSSWLWVATPGCDCPGILSGVSVNMSETDFVPANQTITLKYGRGGGVGELGTMTVYLSEDIFYTEQKMIALNKLYDYGVGYSAGLLGLSHKAAADNTPTLFDNLYAAGKLEKKLFTVSLRDQDDTSLITFGEVDYTNVKQGAEFTYTPLNLMSGDKLYYTLDIQEVKFGDVVVDNHYGIADTGTALLCIPPSVADQFFATKSFENCTYDEEKEMHLCDCDTELPNLEFTIAGQTYVVTPKEYLLPEENGKCFVGFLTITPPGDLFVLGDVFLRNVVAVFDLGNETIGFAPTQQRGSSVCDPLLVEQNRVTISKRSES